MIGLIYDVLMQLIYIPWEYKYFFSSYEIYLRKYIDIIET